MDKGPSRVGGLVCCGGPLGVGGWSSLVADGAALGCQERSGSQVAEVVHAPPWGASGTFVPSIAFHSIAFLPLFLLPLFPSLLQAG